MSNTELNPYSPPPAVEKEQTQRVFPVFLLWIAPWKINVVSHSSANWNCAVFGFAGITIQIGLFLAVLVGQIDEPFRDLSECIHEVVTSIPFTIVFAGFFSSIFLPLIVSTKPWVRPLTLIPWASLGLYALWIVCFFCRTINHPYFGIINDDRPGWMTNNYVLAFGSLFMWTVMMLMAVAWVRFRSDVESDS